MNTHRSLFYVFALPLLVACSSSSDGPAGSGGTVAAGQMPEAFSDYCVGTLLTQQRIETPNGAGSWAGGGATVPAGTTFLVSADFNLWGGFFFQADGSVARLDADFQKGLVKDTDFTSSCATDASSSSARVRSVVLAPSKVFAKEDLSGTACSVDAGTVLENFSFSSGGFGDASAAQVSADAIKSKCGITQGYSKDLTYGALETK